MAELSYISHKTQSQKPLVSVLTLALTASFLHRKAAMGFHPLLLLQVLLTAFCWKK